MNSLYIINLKKFKTIDFEQVNHDEKLKIRMRGEDHEENEFYEFAVLYLKHCGKLVQEDEIESQAYSELVKLDSKIGIPAVDQLVCCLNYTTRWDIIKVDIFVLIYFCNKNHLRRSTLRK